MRESPYVGIEEGYRNCGIGSDVTEEDIVDLMDDVEAMRDGGLGNVLTDDECRELDLLLRDVRNMLEWVDEEGKVIGDIDLRGNKLVSDLSARESISMLDDLSQHDVYVQGIEMTHDDQIDISLVVPSMGAKHRRGNLPPGGYYRPGGNP